MPLKNRTISQWIVLSMIMNLSIPAAAQQNGDKTYNVAGQHGSNASDGGAGGYGGGRGGDAGPAGAGQGGGNIQIQIQRPKEVVGKPYQGSIVISGALKDPQGNTQSVSETVGLGDGGELHLQAQGGGGGHGGVGGRGGDGSRGSDGSNATQYSSGGDGGTGGSGGNGGNGSSGKAGGHGGKIDISIKDTDTDLLMLVGNVNVTGGRGGQAGENGKGGDGGPGGSGGSGYTWTEQTYSGTDSKGNSQYTTTFHSNPGGSDGSRGSDGNAATASLYGGQDGENGNFQIQVSSAGGSKSYNSIYSLQVMAFSLHPTSGHNIFEPGGSGIVENIRVKNTGGMPTPSGLPVEITVPDGTWVKSRSEKLMITKSLAPNEEIILPGPIHFDLRDIKAPAVGDRLKSQTSISPIGRQVSVNRLYKNFQKPTSFEVTFPLEITPIQTSQTLAGGQTAELFWKVKNISDKPFGALSDLKREISTILKLDPTQISTKEFKFRDSQGQSISLDQGFVTAISMLKPGDETVISGKITIKPEAVAYTKVNLQSRLLVGRINTPDFQRAIQYQNLQINIAQVFHKSPDSKILLVTNNQTTNVEVDAWYKLFRSMGLKADVWDTNYEGFLEFHKALVSSDNGTLAKLFGRTLVVVLNNDRTFKTDPSKMIQADAMIPKKDLLRSAAEDRINFYFVGKDKNWNDQILGFFLLPSGLEAGPQFDAEKKIFNIFKNLQPNVHVSAANISLDIHWIMDKPSTEDIEKEAMTLETKLQDKFPDRRYFVIHQFDGSEDTAKKSTFGTNYHFGKLQVLQSLPMTQTSITSIAVPNEVMHTEAFVLGKDNLRGFLDALPLDEKINAFKWGVNAQTPYAKDAMDALLVDIATEQNSMIAREVSSDLKTRMVVFDRILSRLVKEVKVSTLVNKPADKFRGDLVLELLAKIQYIADCHSHWYWWLGIGGTDRDISKIVDARIKAVVPQMFGENKGRFLTMPVPFMNASTKEQISDQDAAIKVEKDLETGLLAVQKKKGDPLSYDLKDLNSSILTRDSNLRTSPDSLVFSRDHYNDEMKTHAWVKENQKAYAERRLHEKQAIESLTELEKNNLQKN